MGPGRYLRTAWGGLPVWARWVLAVYLVGFTDGTANTSGNWSRVSHDPAWLVRPAGLLVLIVFGAFVLATAPAMLRVTSRAAQPRRPRRATRLGPALLPGPHRA